MDECEAFINMLCTGGLRFGVYPASEGGEGNVIFSPVVTCGFGCDSSFSLAGLPPQPVVSSRISSKEPGVSSPLSRGDERHSAASSAAMHPSFCFRSTRGPAFDSSTISVACDTP